nr:MAG TPA: Small Terminase [Caudoviricetes sp.]
MADVKEQIKNDYLSGIPPKKLAGKYDISLNTIKSWIKRYGWSEIKKRGALSNTRGAPSDVSRKRKQGGQPGNKNAVGGGAPEQNKNAEKYGFFSKYLPDETREIFSAIEQADPLDLLWHQIQIAYAAIVRAQRIAYVKDQDDKTIEKIEEKVGNVIGQKWEVQQAWDKQENFLKAQARAQGELRAMIKQYDEMLHKDWEAASEEQKARIEQIRTNTARMSSGDSDMDEGVEIINDAPEETSQDIGYSDSEVSADI